MHPIPWNRNDSVELFNSPQHELDMFNSKKSKTKSLNINIICPYAKDNYEEAITTVIYRIGIIKTALNNFFPLIISNCIPN